MSRFRGVIHNDHMRETSKESKQAMGIGVRGQKHGIYVKAIVRDGQDTFFVNIGDECIAMLVTQEDGSYRLEQRNPGEGQNFF